MGGRLNNKVGWNFPRYIIKGGLKSRGNGKPKNYVFVLNVKKQI